MLSIKQFEEHTKLWHCKAKKKMTKYLNFSLGLILVTKTIFAYFIQNTFFIYLKCINLCKLCKIVSK